MRPDTHAVWLQPDSIVCSAKKNTDLRKAFTPSLFKNSCHLPPSTSFPLALTQTPACLCIRSMIGSAATRLYSIYRPRETSIQRSP